MLGTWVICVKAAELQVIGFVGLILVVASNCVDQSPYPHESGTFEEDMLIVL